MERDRCLSYEAPQMEVIEVEVEKGFAQSQEGNAPVWENGYDFSSL